MWKIEKEKQMIDMDANMPAVPPGDEVDTDIQEKAVKEDEDNMSSVIGEYTLKFCNPNHVFAKMNLQLDVCQGECEKRHCPPCMQHQLVGEHRD